MPVDSLQFLNLQINHQTGVLAELSRQIKDLTEKVSRPESEEARKAEIEKLQAELIQVKHERDEARREVAQFVKVEHERDEARREVARLNLAVLETERRTKNDMLAQNKQEVERKLAQAKEQHDKELAMLSQQDALELTVTKQRHAVELERLKEANEKELEFALDDNARKVQRDHAANEAMLRASIIAKEKAHQLILEQHASQVEELTTALENTKRAMAEQTEHFQTVQTHLVTNLRLKKTKIQEQDQELVQAYSEIQRLVEQAQLVQLTQEPKPEPTKNAKQTLAKLEKLKAEVDQKQVQLAAQAADLARREKELDKRASLLKKEAEKEAAQNLDAKRADIQQQTLYLMDKTFKNGNRVYEKAARLVAAKKMTGVQE
jgi:hypothetical protein